MQPLFVEQPHKLCLVQRRASPCGGFVNTRQRRLATSKLRTISISPCVNSAEEPISTDKPGHEKFVGLEKMIGFCQLKQFCCPPCGR